MLRRSLQTSPILIDLNNSKPEGSFMKIVVAQQAL